MDEEVDYSKQHHLKVFPVIIYLLTVALLAYVTQDEIPLVIFGMFPALINLFILFLFDPNRKENQIIAIASPVIFSLIFVIIWSTNMIPTVSQMNGPVLAFLNLALGYIITMFFLRHRRIKTIEKIEYMMNDVGSEGNEDLDDTIIGKQKIDFDETQVSDLKNTVEHFKTKAHDAEKELIRLQGQVSSLYSKSSNDADRIYRLREELAKHEKDNEEEVDALKRLMEYVENSDSHIDEIEDLRDIISQQNKKVVEDSHEIHKLKETLAHLTHELRVTKQNMPKTLRSIEDKCKAINFVIGRVYSDKKGGSKEIRDMINIPRDWYNTFSKIMKNPKNVDKNALVQTLQNIMERLALLERQERHFLPIKKGWVDVQRHRHDTVLDILENNDDDPIREYHSEAKEICTKLMHYLNDM